MGRRVELENYSEKVHAPYVYTIDNLLGYEVLYHLLLKRQKEGIPIVNTIFIYIYLCTPIYST